MTLATSFVSPLGRSRHQRHFPTTFLAQNSFISHQLRVLQISSLLTARFTRPISASANQNASLLTYGLRRASISKRRDPLDEIVVLRSRSAGNRTQTQIRTYADVGRSFARTTKYIKDQTTSTSSPHSQTYSSTSQVDSRASRAEILKKTSDDLIKATSRIAASIKDDYPHQQFELGDESDDDKALKRKLIQEMADQAKIIDGTAIAK